MWTRAERAALERGRVVCVWGPPQVGVSTACRVVHEESETPTALVVASARALASLEAEVRAARKRGVEVILIDGLPRTVADVQWLYDEHFAPDPGIIVRLRRNAQFTPQHDTRAASIETHAQLLGITPRLLWVDDPQVGIVLLLSLAGIAH